jgi:hypothetical protein
MWHNSRTFAAGVAVFLLGSACAGQHEPATPGPPETPGPPVTDPPVPVPIPAPSPAPVVRFVGISDAVALNFFEATTSAPDSVDSNTLRIGFDTGSDPTTLIARDFRASALPFSHKSAMDTISFTIQAPAGYFVSRVIYAQEGNGATGRTDISAGGANWVVAGIPDDLGVFSNDPNLSGTVDLTSLRLSSVPVSITVSLFASTGSVAVTGAAVHAELTAESP